MLSFYASLGGIPWLPCLSSMVVMESYTQSYGKSVWKEAHLVAAHSWSPPKSTHGSRFFLKWVEVCLHWLWHVMALCCNVMWQNMNKENQISHLNSHCVEFTWPEALGLWATLNPAKPEATSPDRYRVYWGIFSWRRKPRYLGHVT